MKTTEQLYLAWDKELSHIPPPSISDRNIRISEREKAGEVLADDGTFKLWIPPMYSPTEEETLLHSFSLEGLLISIKEDILDSSQVLYAICLINGFSRKIKKSSTRKLIDLMYGHLPPRNIKPSAAMWMTAEAIALSFYHYQSEPRRYTEAEMQSTLVKEWDAIEKFRNYRFEGIQHRLEDGDIIDILAKDKATNQAVIIELKTGCKNPKKQLFAYARFFDSPILIAITELYVNKPTKGVLYFTMDELLGKGGSDE